ncbi:L-glutamate gamma-semialdehyde dehydrogenase [Dactylosporangium fulvum]|uniref:L-glutamate gamma-semialdehyde dehydrogenase n=1 Tax=Dactylosporangium fulvum TaxID=53359 RepID=A0ABY5W9L9_9ACTN|nr:L-glutamate gamma-semialdehyde dehydrogenase [Dactylosporangium fulvum]UWP86567.1 L-glutamate gamma-semialdehyde dehydrogenase [Dactylosporangium fulvum]
MDAVTAPPAPRNETVRQYRPGSPERVALEVALRDLQGGTADLPCTIGGVSRLGSGTRFEVTRPDAHRQVLGVLGEATETDATEAVRTASDAAEEWSALPFDDRAAVFLKAADLLSGPWRATLTAATMLGQSKTAVQAEIDAACELADFWRFNVHFARELLAEQPAAHQPGEWNRLDHRPLDGFVYAVTPFNFTAIAANLPTAPALMGNTVVWKPAPTQTLAACLTLRLLAEAGLPPGVINLLTGTGAAVSSVVLADPRLAGIHFTGSTATFKHLWRSVAANLDGYRAYPRLVGETGGKDFVVAHSSADPQALITALLRGAFDYQGQKCSAASRAYLPASLWAGLKDELIGATEALTMGPVTDLGNFLGAVIDDRSFARNRAALDRARAVDGIEILAGGSYDDADGYFIRPTILSCADPGDEIFSTEYFGPILAVHVYPDDDFEGALRQADEATPYALTGSVFARDRRVIAAATARLRRSAGNFYVNDKPTGAVVGQQPFGGSRMSGTNDKAGAGHNLRRWVSPRSIKETFVPPVTHGYPHMEA